jgi:hypothetical protein
VKACIQFSLHTSNLLVLCACCTDKDKTSAAAVF